MLSLLSLHLLILRYQTFEFLKKSGFPQITFFRKVRETNIYYKSFSKFNSAHYV